MHLKQPTFTYSSYIYLPFPKNKKANSKIKKKNKKNRRYKINL